AGGRRIDGAADAARTTTATQANRNTATADPGAGQAPGNVESAVATAATDRLRQDASRVSSERLDARGHRREHVLTVAAAGTAAAEPHRYGATADARAGKTRGHIEPAVAATAADRLRDDGARTVAAGGNRS